MTPARRKAVLSHSGGVCGLCLNALVGPVEIDHIIPLELGGDEHLNNLQALHPECHREKTKRDIRAIAKMRRLQRKAQKKTLDATQSTKRQIKSRGFDKQFKRTFSGRVVRREPTATD